MVVIVLVERRQGFAKLYQNEEVVERGRGCARRRVRLPSHLPTRARGGSAGPCPSSKGGAAAKGGCLAPQGKWGAPPH